MKANEHGVELLVTAIIETAVRDYAKALCVLRQNPEDEEARAMRLDVEEFFASAWLTALTTVPGEALLRWARELAHEKIEEINEQSAADRAAFFSDEGREESV